MTSPMPELESKPRNPYIGPRPFRTEDQESFFGRDHEARDLIHLMIAERLVLFYAESGAGKSSLINARLIPGLKARNFSLLPTSRVSGQSSGDGTVDNIFAFNLLLSLDNPSDRDPQRLVHLTLADYLADLDVDLLSAAPSAPESAAGERFDAPPVFQGVRPMALIIDQFEEIFTAHPAAWKQRVPFFEQLSQAMEMDPYLWVVLVMREDFIANLDPYLYLLPGNLRARFYMQRMSYEAALEAVKKPAEKQGRPFEAGVAEDLVNNLRLVAVGLDQEGTPSYSEGQFIEPVQLQVVCFQLWELLEKEGGDRITFDDLKRLAKGKDLAQFISSALADFYDGAIAGAVAAFPQISERRLRDLFSKQLITEARTRGLVFKGERASGELPNEVLNLLENKFIIRTENRGANTWYEIVHDRFVDPILQANGNWTESNPRPYQADAEAWLKSGKDPRKLYDGRRLAEGWKRLEAAPDEFSSEEAAFIRAGKVAADNHRTRRQRVLAVLGSVVVVVMAVLTVFAFRGQTLANEQRVIADGQREVAETAQAEEAVQRVAAESAQSEAEQQRNAALAAQAKEAEQRIAAEAAKAEADRQRQIAEAQTLEAEKQRLEAEKQRLEAEKQKSLAEAANFVAQASRLASLGDYFRAKKLDLSLLMGVGGINLSDNWETRQSLLNSLQVGLTFRLEQDGLPLFSADQVYSLAYSADGQVLAVGYFDGQVKVFAAEGHGELAKPPQDFKSNGPVNALSFSSKDELLASGGEDGSVRIWKIGDSQLSDQYRPFEDVYSFPPVQAVAFQPGGNLLAVATGKDAITLVSHVSLYDIVTKERLAEVDCGAALCSALAWSPDGKNLAFGSDSGSLQIWNADSQKIIRNFGQPHRGSVKGIAWYPDNQRLVSGGLDMRLILWDTVAEKILHESPVIETPVVLCLSLSTNGRYLVVGSNDPEKFLTLWDGETLTPQAVAFPSGAHRLNVKAVAVSPVGDRFASGSLDNSVKLWNYTPVSDLAKPLDFNLNTNNDNRGAVAALAVNGDGQIILAQRTNDAIVRIWTQDEVEPLSRSDLPTSIGMGIVSGQMTAVFGGQRGDVTLVEQSTGKELASFKASSRPIGEIALGGDGQWLAMSECASDGFACNRLFLWDLVQNTRVEMKSDLSSLQLDEITSLAFSADGGILAFGTNDSRIFFYHLDTGNITAAVTEGINIQGSTIPITSLAYSPPDLGLIAAGFADGRVALWQDGSWGPVGEFSVRMTSQVTGLAFRKGADDRWLLDSVNDGGVVWQWQVDRSAWVQLACQLANRTLTVEEQAHFIPASSGYTAELFCPAVQE